MTKQFTGNVNQLSQQINAIVMGMAGAERIFALMDEKPNSCIDPRQREDLRTEA